MNWTLLTEISQIDLIDELSFQKNVLIFKHSTRCGISVSALNRIERHWKEEYNSELQCYYLDLLSYRAISDEVATHYSIEHQSPQTLIIKNGKCIHSLTHSSIHLQELLNH